MHEQRNQPKDNVVSYQDFLDGLGRDDEALANLAGFFDVLIEMNLEHEDEERSKEDDKENPTADL